MEEFGYPPKFPQADKEDIEPADPAKKVKSKVAAKSGDATYQWEILRSLGIKDEDIKKFANPHHWLKYFPPIAKSALKDLGCKASFD